MQETATKLRVTPEAAMSDTADLVGRSCRSALCAQAPSEASEQHCDIQREMSDASLGHAGTSPLSATSTACTEGDGGTGLR